MRSSPWILQLHSCRSQRRFMSTPKIKLKADPSLDLHAERDKLLRPIFKIRDLLLRRENHSLRLRYLSIKQKQIGLSKKNIGVKAYIRKYPNFFEIYAHPRTKEPWCRLSSAMEELLQEERKIYLEIEDEVVMKLRKILMMAKDKRIKAGKIDFARRTLGLPDDFATRVAPAYPQYFRVVGKSPSPFIELVAWDESVAVSEMEKRARIEASKKEMGVSKVKTMEVSKKKEMDSKKEMVVSEVKAMEVTKRKNMDSNIKAPYQNDGFGFHDDDEDDEALHNVHNAGIKGLDLAHDMKMNPSKCGGLDGIKAIQGQEALAFKITLSPGMFLKRKNLELLEKWQKLPYVSPYRDYSWINPGTFIAEKRVVGVLHEVLSLTYEKKALMQVLGRFREEFGLPQTIGKLVNRFPGIFYLSLRGNNKTVILREGYERESYHSSHLIEGNHPLVHLKYKYAQMVLDGPRIRAALREAASSENGERMELEYSSDEVSDVSDSDHMDAEADDDDRTCSDNDDDDYDDDDDIDDDGTCSDYDHTDIFCDETKDNSVSVIRKAKPDKEIW